CASVHHRMVSGRWPPHHDLEGPLPMAGERRSALPPRVAFRHARHRSLASVGSKGITCLRLPHLTRSHPGEGGRRPTIEVVARSPSMFRRASRRLLMLCAALSCLATLTSTPARAQVIVYDTTTSAAAAGLTSTDLTGLYGDEMTLLQTGTLDSLG